MNQLVYHVLVHDDITSISNNCGTLFTRLSSTLFVSNLYTVVSLIGLLVLNFLIPIFFHHYFPPLNFKYEI